MPFKFRTLIHSLFLLIVCCLATNVGAYATDLSADQVEATAQAQLRLKTVQELADHKIITLQEADNARAFFCGQAAARLGHSVTPAEIDHLNKEAPRVEGFGVFLNTVIVIAGIAFLLSFVGLICYYLRDFLTSVPSAVYECAAYVATVALIVAGYLLQPFHLWFLAIKPIWLAIPGSIGFAATIYLSYVLHWLSKERQQQKEEQEKQQQQRQEQRAQEQQQRLQQRRGQQLQEQHKRRLPAGENQQSAPNPQHSDQVQQSQSAKPPVEPQKWPVEQQKSPVGQQKPPVEQQKPKRTKRIYAGPGFFTFPTVLCGLCALVWGAMAVNYYHAFPNEGIPRFLAFISVMALQGFLGFSVLTLPGCIVLGWEEEKQVPKSTLSSLILLAGYVATKVAAASLPDWLTLFETGGIFMGAFVYYLGLLVMSSKWYSRKKDADGNLLWKRYAMMQVVTIVSGLAAFYLGGTFHVGALLGIGGTFFVIYLLEKYYEIPWKGIGWAWSLLGVAVFLYFLVGFAGQNPQFFIWGIH